MPDPVVLIVEDEPMVRILAAEFMAELGYQVAEADNAQEALSILETRPDIKLLFADVNMPGKRDSVALASEVHKRWPDILLMLTSGRKSLDMDAMPTGCEFIGKPYDYEQLADKLQGLFSR